MCTFCFREKETIEHILYECHREESIYTWLFKSEFINTINYHLKYYKYSSQCKDNQLLLTKFRNIWKEVYYIERNITYKNKCKEQFENKWKLFEKLSEL